MPFSAKVVAELIGSFSKTKGQALAAADISYRAPQTQLATGTGPNQADLFYRGLGRSIVGAVNDDIDLSGATLDITGDPLPLVRVKGFLIYAYAANPAAIRLGNAAAPFLGPFTTATHTFDIPADGVALHTFPGTGWLVTGATADILRLANPTAVTTVYDIHIWGTSA